MNKLVVVIMGQNCEKFIPMCLESVKDADAIVYCDGGSTDKTLSLFSILTEDSEYADGTIIENPYDQEDKAMNGKQRNFYLNYLKQNYPNDWALCLDADEVCEDIGKVKEFIQTASEGLYSVKMRHFIGNLGFEDATQQIHYALNRLFKISNAIEYPLVEHPVLQGSPTGATICTTIFHLAYIQGLFDIKKKYENHLAKSNMHTPEYLDNWKDMHILGAYPTKPVNLLEIPEIILKNFNINKDKYYFQNRGIELKNILMVKQWNDYFKPESVLDLGCGRGAYMLFWKWFVEDVDGIEISQFAVDNAFCNDVHLGDVSKEEEYAYVDLITAVDILEHLNDSDLNKTLINMTKYGKRFLFSIPYIGDPNLLADKTHLQHKTKEEWIQLIQQYGIKVSEAPKEWYFSHQILIGSK